MEVQAGQSRSGPTRELVAGLVGDVKDRTRNLDSRVEDGGPAQAHDAFFLYFYSIVRVKRRPVEKDERPLCLCDLRA